MIFIFTKKFLNEVKERKCPRGFDLFVIAKLVSSWAERDPGFLILVSAFPTRSASHWDISLLRDVFRYSVLVSCCQKECSPAVEALGEKAFPCFFQLLDATHIPWLVPFPLSAKAATQHPPLRLLPSASIITSLLTPPLMPPPYNRFLWLHWAQWITSSFQNPYISFLYLVFGFSPGS